jgi:peptidoglycan hydrolase-like protein with peptidoglycan-binding domain
MIKYFLLLVGVLAFHLTPTTAQNLYTVQVGTFVDVRPQDFDGIRPLGFLYDQQVNDNLHQVFLGRFRSESKAQTLLPALQQQGFTNARVQQVAMSTVGQQAVIIQIATRYSNKTISWEELQRVGPLNVILDEELIKVTTGTFPDVATAKNALPAIQAQGFADAFIKTVPVVQLIPVTPLSTGLKEALIPLKLRDTQARGSVNPTLPPTVQPEAVPPVLNTPPSAPTVPRPAQPAVIPGSYGDGAAASRITTTARPPAEKPLPTIRGDVKRRSALELQKLLKAKGYYSSTLDGYYGPGTKGAYEQFRASDVTYDRYASLAAASTPGSGPMNALQTAINDLPYSDTAPVVIERSQVPTALAYQAYLLFSTLGNSTDVNRLMNQANQQAFRGVERRLAPFDYQATYAYQDLGQLLQHLFYIHLAPGNEYQLPCWLRERHPQEVAVAVRMLNSAAADLPWGNCTSVMEWAPLQELYGLAMHMGGAEAFAAQAELQQSANRRQQLLARTTGLDPVQVTTLEVWQQTLWAKLNDWSRNDVYLDETVTALKLAYYQSQVLLEDHFMAQGISANDATGLARGVLQTIIELPLERFL